MTTSKAHEKVLLSYTHMVFFAVFLFVTLNIRAKFLFLPFKDGGHRCDLCFTDTWTENWRENVVITSLSRRQAFSSLSRNKK